MTEPCQSSSSEPSSLSSTTCSSASGIGSVDCRAFDQRDPAAHRRVLDSRSNKMTKPEGQLPPGPDQWAMKDSPAADHRVAPLAPRELPPRSRPSMCSESGRTR
jgi:hypothetical protein